MTALMKVKEEENGERREGRGEGKAGETEEIQDRSGERGS